MNDSSGYVFGPFRLDPTRDRLWREQEAVELRAKPLAVLRYLLEHPGQVVTRAELLKQVWTGIYATKTALRVCLREIRLALGDEATAPQYKDVVKLGTGLIATMAALVLGLLVASAKSSYDTQRSELAQVSANVILLDRVIAHYGPETKDARDLLHRVVVRVLGQLWPQDRACPGQRHAVIPVRYW